MTKQPNYSEEEFLQHFNVDSKYEDKMSTNDPYERHYENAQSKYDETIDETIDESNASVRKNYQYFRKLMPKNFNYAAMDPRTIHYFNEDQPGGYDRIQQKQEDNFIFLKGLKKHRTDGPAVICFGRYVQWWIDHKLHRINGPALINFDMGWCDFYVNGKQLSKKEYLKHFDIDDKWEAVVPDSLELLEQTEFEKIIEEAKTQRAKNWNGYEVDAQLKDKWLEDMNSFMTVYPISVCYGHPAHENDHRGGGGAYAGINMRMDDTKRGDTEDFDKLCLNIWRVLKGTPNTRVEVGLKTHGNGKIPSAFVGWPVIENGKSVADPNVKKKIESGEYQIDTAVFHFDCKFKTEGNEEKVDKWFEAVIKKMKSIFM